MGFTVDTDSFTRAMNEMADVGKLAKDILPDQAQKLISNGFAGGGGLYQECRVHAPDTIAEIKGLPAKYGYRIKRLPGVTVAKEIIRRLKNAGYVQSTGWLNRVYKGKNKDAIRHVRNPRGEVEQSLTGLQPYIILTNRTPGAAEFAEKTGYVQRAIDNRAKDMLVYVQRKLAERAKKLFG